MKYLQYLDVLFKKFFLSFLPEYASVGNRSRGWFTGMFTYAWTGPLHFSQKAQVIYTPWSAQVKERQSALL